MSGRIITALYIFLATVRVAAAQPGVIQWARFGWWYTGGNGFSPWVCVSTERQQLYTSTSGGSECWPTNYSSKPLTKAGVFDTSLNPIIIWPGGICPPHMPKGDSSLIFYNGYAFGEWYPNTGVLDLIARDTEIVSSLDVSPDGSLIAAVWQTTNNSSDDSLHVLNRFSGKQLWAIPAGGIARFSPDGKLLLTALNDTSAGLELVEVANHTIIHRYSQLHGSYVDNLAWDPAVPGLFVVDGLSIIAYGGSSALMDTSGKIHSIGYFAVGSSEFNSIDFSPDGKYLVSTGSGVLQVEGGQMINIADPFQAGAEADDVEFLNNDTFVSVSSTEVALFSVSHGGYIRTISSTIITTNLEFSGDGAQLVSGCGRTEAATGLPIVGRHGYTDGPSALSYDGSTFSSVDDYGQVDLWSDALDSFVTLQKPVTDTGGFPACIAFSPVDTAFATSVYFSENDPHNAVQLWGVNSQSLIRTFSSRSPVIALAFSHDGSMLAELKNPYVFNQLGIIIWRVSDGSKLYDISDAGTSIAFLPGDSSLFIGDEGEVDIYSLRTHQLVAHQNDAINADHFALLPNGKACMGVHTGSINMFEADSGVQYIDINSGNVIRSFQTPDSGHVNCVAVNPVTGDVAVGGQDVIVYKALGSDAVAEAPRSANPTLSCFASNRSITVRSPGQGKLFVYDVLGVCCFSQEAQPGEGSITTGILPAGNYFIVFKPEHGAPEFTKVSVF